MNFPEHDKLFCKMILIEIGQSRNSEGCVATKEATLGYVGFYLPPAGFSLMLELLPPPPGGGRSQSADFGRCILRLLRKSIALDNMRNGLRRSEMKIEHLNTVYKNKILKK